MKCACSVSVNFVLWCCCATFLGQSGPHCMHALHRATTSWFCYVHLWSAFSNIAVGSAVEAHTQQRIRKAISVLVQPETGIHHTPLRVQHNATTHSCWNCFLGCHRDIVCGALPLRAISFSCCWVKQGRRCVESPAWRLRTAVSCSRAVISSSLQCTDAVDRWCTGLGTVDVGAVCDTIPCGV